jgi:hypothetical protein
MSEPVGFILDRAVKTISAARSLAPAWEWPESTAEQMQDRLTGIVGNTTVTPPVIGQQEIVSTADRAKDAAQGAWEQQLVELHRRTVQAVGMIKNKFRDTPASLAVVRNLSASSNSRKETLAEALALESAWTNVAPAWNPTTNNTLTAFAALRKQCEEDLQQGYSDAQIEWRKAVTTLNNMANDLEQICEAWYADATRVFLAGTPEGDMIRGSIPTTYTPPPQKPAPAPAPAAPTAQPNPPA